MESHSTQAEQAADPLAAVFARAPVPLLLLRADGHVVAANARAAALLPPPVQGAPLERCFQAPARPALRAALARAAEGTPAEGEWPLAAAGDGDAGSGALLRVRLAPLGQAGRVVAALEDVSAQRRREGDLEHALQATAEALERVTDGFVSLDREWRYTFVNSEAARLLGRPRDQLLGRNIWQEFPDGVGQPFHRAYERAMAEQVPQTLVDYYTPFHRWFENRIYPSPQGVSIYFHDVTESVRAREHLERLNASLGRERQWLELLLERLPVALALVEQGSARVLFANALAVRTLGGLLAGADAPRTGPLAGWCSDAAGRRLEAAELPQVRLARGEVFEALELEWHAPGGARSLLCTSALLEGDRARHDTTGVLVLQDVTELKRVQEALARSVRERDEFMSVASHELKTPLTGLTLQIHRLLQSVRGSATAAALQRQAAPLHRSIARLDALVQTLLDVSRLRAGRLQLEPEPLALEVLVREVLGRLADQLAQAGCALQTELASGVWGVWDRGRLEQVVGNLLTNAAKYGPGAPIHVRLEADGSWARLQVRDRGIGIAPEAQQRIFESFERAVSARNYGGFGLGLWIVRQTVEAMGGRVRVESRPGEGALFTVELPRGGSPPPDAPSPSGRGPG